MLTDERCRVNGGTFTEFNLRELTVLCAICQTANNSCINRPCCQAPVGAVQRMPNHPSKDPVCLYGLNREIRLLTWWIEVGCLKLSDVTVTFPPLPLPPFYLMMDTGNWLHLKWSIFKLRFEDKEEYNFVTVAGSLSESTEMGVEKCSEWLMEAGTTTASNAWHTVAVHL